MTHEAMSTDGFGQQASGSAPTRSALDRSVAAGRGGSIALVLLVAGFLIAGAAGIGFLGRERAEPYIVIFLAILATVGVFGLFAFASGMLRLSWSQSGNPLIKAVLDGAFDGIVVTDGDGRVIYANAAYLDLIGAAEARDARPVERVFSADPDASEAIYRLLKAMRTSSCRRRPSRAALSSR